MRRSRAANRNPLDNRIGEWPGVLAGFYGRRGQKNDDEIVRFVVLRVCGFRVVRGPSAKCDDYTVRVTAG